jgi:hypothetical protein
MSWQSKAAEVCRAAAGPDLADLPVYVLDAGEAPDMFQPRGCWGYTAPWLSDAFRPFLESRQQWTGPGFATIIDIAKLPFPEAWKGYRAVEIALHELAHFLESMAVRKFMGIDELPIATAQIVQSCAETLDKPPAAEPWSMHGAIFIRAALHLAHRARAAGFSISGSNMYIAGDCYGLSELRHYVSALADELDERFDERITQILPTTEPPEFARLFEADKAKKQ